MTLGVLRALFGSAKGVPEQPFSWGFEKIVNGSVNEAGMGQGLEGIGPGVVGGVLGL